MRQEDVVAEAVGRVVALDNLYGIKHDYLGITL